MSHLARLIQIYSLLSTVLCLSCAHTLYFSGLIVIQPDALIGSKANQVHLSVWGEDSCSKFHSVLFVWQGWKTPKQCVSLRQTLYMCLFEEQLSLSKQAAKLNLKWSKSCCPYPVGNIVCASSAVPTRSKAKKEVKVTSCWGKKYGSGHPSYSDYATSPHQRLTDLLCFSFRSRQRCLLKFI